MKNAPFLLVGHIGVDPKVRGNVSYVFYFFKHVRFKRVLF